VNLLIGVNEPGFQSRYNNLCMKLLIGRIANEIPRNANEIHLISFDMVSAIVASKIYKLISQNH